MRDGKKTLSLVLGSGGARGLAHIGVIRELEQQGYEIKSISGCSIGALIGGVYAAGKLDDFESWVCAITKADIMGLLDVSLMRGGLFNGDKVINLLIELVGDTKIEELSIPYTAIASDVKNEKEVWISKGRLVDAIRASISLPLFFTPVKYSDSYLVDGGVLNPVPIAPTFHDDTDLTIAVNLGGAVNESERIKADDTPTSEKRSAVRESFNKFVSQFTRDTNKGARDLNAYNVADEAFDAMQSAIARFKLAAHPPDITIEIARNTCGTLEFDLAEQLIAHGRDKTIEYISHT